MRFPLHPNRALEVEDSTVDDVMALHDTLGVSRGVIVQSLMQGHSCEYMLNALCRDPARFRGIAMPAPDITDGELEILSPPAWSARGLPTAGRPRSTPR